VNTYKKKKRKKSYIYKNILIQTLKEKNIVNKSKINRTEILLNFKMYKINIKTVEIEKIYNMFFMGFLIMTL